MPHWTQEFNHVSVTDDNRGAFNTAMSKYNSVDDAIIGGFEAQKMAGKPFKLPESIDKLDETSRTEFTSQAHKLFNIRKAANIDDLKDVNLKDGLPEGSPYDENFALAYKQFVVDEKMNTSDMPKNAKFFNSIMGKMKADAATKAESDNLAKAKACDEALIADPDIGSKENLVVMSERFARALKNECGLDADGVEEVADALAESPYLTKNHKLSKILMQKIGALATEAESQGGGAPSKEKEKPKSPHVGTPTGDALKWK